MAASDSQSALPAPTPRRRSASSTGPIAAAGIAALAIALVWAARIDIAHRLIDRQLRQLQLTARYRIDGIGIGREVLSDVSLGDATQPDLFVKTLAIDAGWRDGLPAITRLELNGARLQARFSGRHLSFGSLDRLIFAPTQVPFRLPDIALTLRHAVVSLAGDARTAGGPIDLAIDGQGSLRDGFSGSIGSVAPSLRIGNCTARGADFHGRVAIRREQPRVSGPLRIRQFACPGSALTIQGAALQVDLVSAATFDGGTARLALATGGAKLGSIGAARLTGSGALSLRKAVLSGNFVSGGEQVRVPSFGAAQLGIAGQLRAALATGAVQADGTLSGRALAPDRQTLALLARAANASAGTLAAPLLASLRSGLARETPTDRLSGSWIIRRTAHSASLTVPEVHVDGAHAAHWVSLSHIVLQQPAGAGRLAGAGDFAIAGRGFPQLRGTVGPLADGAEGVMLAMPRWSAATASLAVPMLAVHWTRNRVAGFAGRVVLSGPLPGGQLTGLTIPLQGSWSARGGLLVGNRCTAVGFDRLTLGGLAAGGASRAGNTVTLCPGGLNGAIIAVNARGLRISARTPGLHLDGRVNGSALSIATGAAAFTWPGELAMANIAITTTGAVPAAGSLNDGAANGAGQAAQLHLARLTASLGPVTTGHFSGGDVSIAAIPAAVRAAAGAFRWAGGRLSVSGGGFRLEGSASQPNFAPISAHDVTLAMADGVITGAASLRTIAANRELAGLTIAHDLASGTGHAEVTMPELVFDHTLQPKQLSALAEGVIADAKGTLTGHGSFAWDHRHITSSGSVATTGFDFAAAFGPVKGVSGNVVFTDLLGLVTAPDQRLTIAAINPGIEVDDGVLTFALQPGHVLAVTGAKWPFLDGQLTLLPTRLVLGATEVRHYGLRVDGLNAAKFLARMDLSNLAATGIFDGNLPLVFDGSGGRITHGLLLSRAPGGAVSYVGALTYKDLSPMANYAFQALRALNYRQMRIAMDGALAGNILTRVSMQGVGQGQGARRNFITNQIARLPIRFDVNINAPFMQLVTSFRSLYDPAMVADPRTLGLIDAQGRPIVHPAPDNAAPDPKAPIQP